MSAPHDPKQQQSEDAAVRGDAGLQLVVSLCAVLRVARSYDSHNQAYKTQLSRFAKVLEPVLSKSKDVVLAVFDNDLYLNGVRIPVNAFSFRFQRTVVECFERAEIAGMRVSQVADPNELGRFFELLLDEQGPRGMELVAACRAAGLAHTQVAIYATNKSAAASDSATSGETEAAGDGSLSEELLRTLHKESNPLPSTSFVTTAMKGVQSILAPATTHSRIELRHAKRLVQPLVDATKASEPLLVGASVPLHHEREIYGHVISVATVALAIGQSIGLDRASLADLGVAALYHDVGISVLEDQLKNPPESLTIAERTLLKRHTIEGAKLLASNTTLNRTALRSMRVALEHHVLRGGTGYPKMPEGWRPSLLSRIVSIADCYVSLIGRTTESGARTTPYMALGMILGPLQDRFDAPLLMALVAGVGFYPPGQVVELSDGTLALAIAPNPADLARPDVLVLTDAEWRPSTSGRVLRPLPATMSVRRALGNDEVPSGVQLPEDPPEAQAA